MLILSLILGCSFTQTEPPAQTAPVEAPARATTDVARVVMFAADGATWRVMDPLMSVGEMPNLQKLTEAGCKGELESLTPSLSPRIWTSVATGVPPSDHGIKGFVYKQGKRRRLYNSGMVQRPRLWDMASSRGVKVGVTNYWFTYPAYQVDGFIISDHILPWRSERINAKFAKGQSPDVRKRRLAYPKTLNRKVRKLVDNTPGGRRNLTPTSPEVAKEVHDAILLEDRLVMRMADRGVRREGPVGLDIRYTKGLDAMSHMFWKFHNPTESVFQDSPATEAEIEQMGSYVGDAYRQFDALLGKQMASMGPNDVFIIASDHGFEGRNREVRPHVTGRHGGRYSKHGVFVMSGGPVTNTQCPSSLSLYDVAPTTLHMMGLAVPQYMQGRVATELFRKDWLTKHPVRTFNGTYPNGVEPTELQGDEEEVLDDGHGHDDEEVAPDAPEEERIDWLKQLGYLGGEDGNEDEE